MRLLEGCSGLNESTHLLAQSIHTFCQEHIAPIAHEVDQEQRFARELWPQLGALGCFGLTVHETDGGVGMSYLDHVIAMAIISHASPSIGLAYGAHSNLCLNQIARYGSAEQKARFLPNLISGQWVGALAMSEAGSGSDVISMQLKAKKQGDYFILDGHKLWVTNGPHADVLVVYAKTDPDAHAHGISAFIVTQNDPGWHASKPISKMGMRGAHACELVFDHCRIPKEQVLGPINRGVEVLMSGLDLERLVLSGGPLGIMDACLDITLPYMHQRKQFGQPIGTFQLMQGKIADMYTHYHAAKAYLYQCAQMADMGQLSRQMAASTILFTSEHATQMALQTVQALGGNGYTTDYAAERLLRDAKLYEIGAGTSEIRRMLIGREVFKANPIR